MEKYHVVSFSAGSLKSWDSSIDLVNVLKHEIRDGQLSFRGKRVLEVIHFRGKIFSLFMLYSIRLSSIYSFDFKVSYLEQYGFMHYDSAGFSIVWLPEFLCCLFTSLHFP